MGDALRSYDHYRWAERYARNNNNDKARAHMLRALHYGMSGFGAVGDDGRIKELAESAGLRSEPVNTPPWMFRAARADRGRWPHTSRR